MCGPRYRPQIGKAAQRSEKQEWAKEEPKLDNAQRMRGIYFIDPNGEEKQETMNNNARKKLETPMAPAMPCKRLNRDSFWKRKHMVVASPHLQRIQNRDIVV